MYLVTAKNQDKYYEKSVFIGIVVQNGRKNLGNL